MGEGEGVKRWKVKSEMVKGMGIGLRSLFVVFD